MDHIKVPISANLQFHDFINVVC